MCGEQECAAIEEVEHNLGRRIARGDIQAGKGLVQNHRTARAQLGSGNLDATALPIPHISPLRETAMPRPRKCTNGALFKLCGQ